MPQPYPGQQWKHGWVPITSSAARSKNHGRKVGAGSLLARVVAEAAERHRQTQAAKPGGAAKSASARSASSGSKGAPTTASTPKPSRESPQGPSADTSRGRVDDATRQRLDAEYAEDARLNKMISEDQKRQETDPFYKRLVDIRSQYQHASIEWEKNKKEAYRLSEKYKREGHPTTKRDAEAAAKRRDRFAAEAKRLEKERDEARAISNAQPQNKKGASFDFNGGQWEIADDRIAVRGGVPHYVVKNKKTGQARYAETEIADNIIENQKKRASLASQADASIRSMAARRRTSG